MTTQGYVLYNDQNGIPTTSSELRFDDSTQYPDSRLNAVNLTITEDVHVAGRVGAATANPRQNLEVSGYTLLVGQGSSSRNPYQFGLNGAYDTLSLMSRNGIGTGGAMSIFFGLQSIINYPVARIVAADERGLPTLTFQTGRGSALADRIKIDIDGNTNINGSLIMNGNVVFKVDTWNTSTDGRYRLYLANNSTTLFGSPNGYEFQNSGNVRIAYLDDGGNFSPTGYINFRANLWNRSSDGHVRLFCSYNDRTFFGSQNGYSFRGANDIDIASIDNNGNLYANAGLATGGDITAGAVFRGNGSGLHSVHADSANSANYADSAGSAGSAGRANYADSAGSAPPDNYSPITLYNMSAENSGGLTFIKVGENHYQHYNGWGHADWSFYTAPSGAVPGNFTPAIIVYSDGGTKAIFAVAQGSGNAANFNSSWGGVSDSNLKENIDTARDYTDDLCKLRVVKYNFINDPTYIPFVSTYTSTVSLFISSISTIVNSTVSVTVSTSKQRQIGFIAQEVQNVFPGLVEMNYFENPSTLTYTSCLSLKMSVLTPMLVTAIQNLKARLDSHESTINGQTGLIASLISSINV